MKTLTRITLVLAVTLILVPAAFACGDRASAAMSASNDTAPAVQAPQATTTDTQATPSECPATCNGEQTEAATETEAADETSTTDAAAPEVSGATCPYLMEQQRSQSADSADEAVPTS